MQRKTLVTITVVAVLVAFVSISAAVALAATQGLQPKGVMRVAAVSAFDAVNTSSTSYVDLPNLSTSFKVPAGQTADVIIQFSGSMNSPSALYARAVVDGTAADPNNAGNGPQMFWGVGGGATAQAFNFYKFGVGSGGHTVKIQWAGLSGQQFMSYRSLVVFVNLH